MSFPRPVTYPYASLEDFLTANALSVDSPLNDGANATFPVKAREIQATVLFADIRSFSSRTRDLSPVETLIFVNHFFAWMNAEALRGKPGIIDKYIGDEVMVVYSREFGSEDPFVDAVQTARRMGQNDSYGFAPHIGIASGPVAVGYVGTPLKYNCSVFGAPVALAARCAGIPPQTAATVSTAITFPASEWEDRDFDAVVPPIRYVMPDGTAEEGPVTWELLEPTAVQMKNLPDTPVRQIVNRAFHLPSASPEQRAKAGLRLLREKNRYWPKESPSRPRPDIDREPKVETDR